MKLWLWIGAFAVLAIIGLASGSGSDDGSGGDSSSKATASAARDDSDDLDIDDEPIPDPQAKYQINCDYVLGDFGDSGDPAKGYRFVAGGHVKNTGNIGVVARVRVRWQQLGTAPIMEERKIRVPAGRSKRVAITRPVGQNEIDLHQSADGDCSVVVKLIDTFGKVAS